MPPAVKKQVWDQRLPYSNFGGTYQVPETVSRKTPLPKVFAAPEDVQPPNDKIDQRLGVHVDGRQVWDSRTAYTAKFGQPDEPLAWSDGESTPVYPARPEYLKKLNDGIEANQEEEKEFDFVPDENEESGSPRFSVEDTSGNENSGSQNSPTKQNKEEIVVELEDNGDDGAPHNPAGPPKIAPIAMPTLGHTASSGVCRSDKDCLSWPGACAEAKDSSKVAACVCRGDSPKGFLKGGRGECMVDWCNGSNGKARYSALKQNQGNNTVPQMLACNPSATSKEDAQCCKLGEGLSNYCSSDGKCVDAAKSTGIVPTKPCGKKSKSGFNQTICGDQCCIHGDTEKCQIQRPHWNSKPEMVCQGICDSFNMCGNSCCQDPDTYCSNENDPSRINIHNSNTTRPNTCLCIKPCGDHCCTPGLYCCGGNKCCAGGCSGLHICASSNHKQATNKRPARNPPPAGTTDEVGNANGQMFMDSRKQRNEFRAEFSRQTSGIYFKQPDGSLPQVYDSPLDFDEFSRSGRD